MKRLKFIAVFAALLAFLSSFSVLAAADTTETVAAHTIPMYVWLVIYCILFLAGAYYLSKKKVKFSKESCILILFVVLAISFIIKIAISASSPGFANDVACFESWSSTAAKNLFAFYDSAGFADYPPLYVYFLMISGKFMQIGIPPEIAFRLPPLLAEVLLGILIYKIGRKLKNKEFGLFIAIAYVLNPLVILDTCVWGQMDSFLIVFVALSIYLMIIEKPIWASVVMACAILIKPQGVFFLPLLIIFIIKKKSIKTFLLSGLAGVGTIIAIIIGFQKANFVIDASPTVASLSRISEPLIHQIATWPIIRDILWLADLLTGTASNYDYAAFNAANFYSMLGFNTGPKDSELFLGIPFSIFGFIMIAVILIISIVTLWKCKNKGMFWLNAAFLNAGIFMFATRMHERYMFSVFALLLIAWLFTKDWITPILAVGFTITNYLNVDDCLTRMLLTNYPHIPSDSTRMIVTSFFNFFLFLILTFVLVLLAKKNQLPSLAKTNENCLPMQ